MAVLSSVWSRNVGRRLALAWAFVLGASSLVGVDAITVGPNPESVARGFGGKFFVTLMGETRTPGDGNGRIVRIEGDTVEPFADGFDDPKGLVFADGVLITADFTKVWRVDAAARKTLLAGPEAFPHAPVYLNDLAVAPDGQGVYVVDMGAAAKMRAPDGQLWPLDSDGAKALPAIGRVYLVSFRGEVTEVIAPDAIMPCPNGVDAFPDGRLRVAEFFTGKILEWRSGAWRVLADGHRSADGIVHDARGRFYVTEVATGNVFRYEADGSGRTDLCVGLASAADLCLDEPAGVALVPDTKRGLIVRVPMK